MAEMNGKDFRARVELTNKANTVVAAVGETCERVDPKSLGWLFEQKLIEPTGAAWSDLGRAVDEPIGIVEDARMFDTALSDAEVKAIAEDISTKDDA